MKGATSECVPFKNFGFHSNRPCEKENAYNASDCTENERRTPAAHIKPQDMLVAMSSFTHEAFYIECFATISLPGH
jgi:hypothetical protein